MSVRSRFRSWKSLLVRSSEYLLSDEFKRRIEEEDDTMVHVIPILSQMNSHGYLTVDSQEGNVKRFRNKGITYTQKQRSYVAGLMHISMAKLFIPHMNLETDMCAINVPIVCSDCDLKLPAALDIPLSTLHAANKKTKVETHMSTAIPFSVVVHESGKLFLDSYSKVTCKQFINSGDIVYVFCWDPIWGRNDLFSKILKSLKLYK